MLRMARYDKTRFWALWDGNDLVAVVVYKKGAAELLRRLAAQPPAATEAAAQAAAVEAAARHAQTLAAQAQALARQARAQAAWASRRRNSSVAPFLYTTTATSSWSSHSAQKRLFPYRATRSIVCALPRLGRWASAQRPRRRYLPLQ